MNIPISLKTPDSELPELDANQFRHVLAKDGAYIERRTSCYATCTPYTGPFHGLETHHPYCHLLCGQIPVPLVRAMLGFFQAAYAMHGGEAALVLLYHPLNRRFRWYCPEQSIEVYRGYDGRRYAFDSVQYQMPLEIPPGYVIFGDAHSHGALSASPSATDLDDEIHKDGLHLIVGRVDEPMSEIDFNADFVMDGYRFSLPIESVLPAFRTLTPVHAPNSWMRRIHMVSTKPWSKTSNFFQ